MEMSEREKAFNKLFDWWVSANAFQLTENQESPFTRSELARAAAAAGWNAALTWVAEQIGEKGN